MSQRIEVTAQTVDDFFDGILIPCEDIAGRYRVPGWRCHRCGWAVGTTGLPPAHDCPARGMIVAISTVNPFQVAGVKPEQHQCATSGSTPE